MHKTFENGTCNGLGFLASKDEYSTVFVLTVLPLIQAVTLPSSQ